MKNVPAEPPVRILGRTFVVPEWATGALLLLVAMLPTIAIWNRATYLSGDSYQYLRAASTLSRGEGMQDMSGQPFVFLGPMYSLFVGVVHSIVRIIDLETTARIVSFLGASLAVVAFYWLVRQRHSRMLAILAALVFALLPLRSWSGQWVLTNGLALGLTLSGVALLFYRQKPQLACVIGAGLLLGLSYLTRSDALIFCAGSFVYLLLFAVSSSFRSRLIVSSVFLASVALVALPYHFWVHEKTGAWSNNAAVYNLDVANDLYQGTPAPLAGWHFDSSSSTFVRRAPDLGAVSLVNRYLHFAREEFTRLIYLVGPRWLVFPLLLIGSVKFLIALSRRRIDAMWQALLLSLLFVLPFFHTEDRYLLPVVPVLCLWLVDGAMSLGNWFTRHWSQQLPALNPLWISTVLVVLVLGNYAYRLSTQLPPDHSGNLPREVAGWMQTNKLGDGRIMAQEPALAFYRDADHVWLPDGPIDDVIRYARRQDVRYIFISSVDQSLVSQRLLPDAHVHDLLPRGSFAWPGTSAKLFELAPETTSSR